MTFYAISALINAITSSILGTLLLLKNKKSKLFILFALFTYSVAGWSILYFLWQIETSAESALFYTRAFMAFAVFIPFFYFHFVTVFTKREKNHFLSISTGYIFAGSFSYLSTTQWFVLDVTKKLNFVHWPVPGDFFLPFLVVWLVYIFYGSAILLSEYLNSSGHYKLQIRFILIGMVIGYLGGITNYFLWYDIPIPPFGNILVTFYVLMVSYAVIRYKLFNLRVIVAEFIVFSLWILAVVRLVLSNNSVDYLYNSLYLVAVIIIGILLIYNVRREVSTREEVQKLASKLEKSNQRLKALDKQKSEFVSIASHQLRSPLTAIRGYASMLTEGSFGKFPKKAKEPLERIAESARIMALSIEDYLSVSRIESGNMKYENSVFKLPERVEKTVDDLQGEAVKSGLLLMYKNKATTEGKVHADEGKVQQILHNLINNALKYTKEGSIDVVIEGSKKDKEITVSVIDTGIGMSEETLATIFQKFQRSKNANSVNVHGTGLGLYVALKMANDMGGDIVADSEGDGKGSTFTFSLPITDKEKSSKAQ